MNYRVTVSIIAPDADNNNYPRLAEIIDVQVVDIDIKALMRVLYHMEEAPCSK